MTPEHTIAALCKRSDVISREKGWVKEKDERPFSTSAALMHSEISEALEEYRNNKGVAEIYYTVKIKKDSGDTVTTTCKKEELPALKNMDSKYGRGDVFIDAKPEGIPIELADLVIRICQRCGTDGESGQLESALAGIRKQLVITDFEEVSAKLHLLVSLSYQDVLLGYSPFAHLAEALQMTFTFCEAYSIDLWSAIDEKEAFNRTRPMRHGGKKI